jgi:DNA-binding beta-propeller fold protein YncE
MFAGRPPIIARHDLTGRTTRVLKLAGEQGALGEQVLMWSLVGTPDGRTLYAVNPAIGVIDEIDVASLELRRTAALMASRPRGFLDAVAMALHPVAYAKRGVTNGAVLSPDGSTLYAIGETGVWSVETRSLKGRLLTKEGTYATIVLSPDGMRIYAIGFDDGVVRVVSARDGSSLGAMTRYAWPSNIVAVDVSP